ncbi:response regulator [Falsirhodobacter sp. alg1]|uniref:response regulator n=1 Tax=Falsirhodobacter sp. alg1 TaxID=1472418 RepID=UPI000786A551|nr:response regulator [Falsirhodobacter sp. alg1]
MREKLVTNWKNAGLPALMAASVLAVFLADLSVQRGTAVWIAYLVPVILSWAGRKEWLPPVTAFFIILIMIVGFFFAQPGIDPNIAAVNRVMGAIIIAALGTIGFLFVRYRDALRMSDWLGEGNRQLSRAMEGDLELNVLGDSVITMLGDRIGARAAVFYARETDGFVRIAQYGLAPGAVVAERFGVGESHLWRAVNDRSVVTLDRLPTEALAYGSALASAPAATSVVVPVMDEGRVNGVMEFGFDRAVPDYQKRLLRDVADPVGIAVRSARDRVRLRSLLEETRRQAEELQSHGEELAASNEELTEQARALEESQQRLERQQAELEEQNAQLEGQTQELEVQRDELARAQRMTEQQASRLEAESRYKSEFVANMSHELRTPLNALLIMSRLLAENRSKTLTAEQVDWAETIESSGKDLLALINDILDLAKIEAGKLDIASHTLRAPDIAAKLERTFGPQAQNKGIGLVIDVPEDLPTVETDSSRLEQILRNFLSNAIKFTDRGEVTLSIRPDGDGLVFAVRDTGIGIAKADQDAIFEAFRQADGTISRRYGGTGLGLSISRELTELLGGRVTVESTPGKGSTFALHLPANMSGKPVPKAVSPVAVSRRAEPMQVPANPPAMLRPRAGLVKDDREVLDGDKRLILVIEDDPAFARILVDLSHELGFQCIVAGNAEDGVLAARQYLPSAVVLDFGLPDHSGLSVLDRLKRDTRTRHIPVHMVSVEDYTREALAQGARSYMLKPVRREELALALDSIESRINQRMRRVLIVEDDPAQLTGLKALLGTKDVETVGASTAAEGARLMKAQSFDCLVLDMTLPDASGFDLLESLDADTDAAFPPVIVYTARELSAAEELRLRRYSKSIIIKGAKSPERLIDEVTLFLHQVVSDLPERQQQMLAASLNRDALLEGRRILVVEDDIRNVYALTAIFEPHGAEVQIARNGREALEALGRVADGAAGIDLVLMDVMMPEMDGLTATREIRRQDRWKSLPIIMLTAKAMADDQDQCLAAGANDYLSKPLDVDRLLSLTRVWMPR